MTAGHSAAAVAAVSIFPPVAVLHRPVEQYLCAVRMLVPLVRAATLCCAPARLWPVQADLCLCRGSAAGGRGGAIAISSGASDERGGNAVAVAGTGDVGGAVDVTTGTGAVASGAIDVRTQSSGTAGGFVALQTVRQVPVAWPGRCAFRQVMPQMREQSRLRAA